ncbi:unnamed protein product [Bursaphelenchus okinawaensis]|uniref:Tyrosine-protein phosphatase domain-containing protein n=1 Tax=Bursaphelenchus okinawaensis TaxID=465554 RepID=A0A811JT34_9BILA|nr:unnamed protein product [Bursaphelenchus okinawaensis]CAG9082011.1 unnamed protein product [Bursaphelenchus okinawaensis]
MTELNEYRAHNRHKGRMNKYNAHHKNKERANKRGKGVELLNLNLEANPEVFGTLFTRAEDQHDTHLSSDKAPLKCRFDDVHCYDSTRVVLKNKETFVHANKLYLPDQREFILTQMPLLNTVDDFWNMVWQEKAYAVLVILSKEDVKYDRMQMLPEKRADYYGDNILVNQQMEAVAFDDLRLSVLGLSKDRERRHLRWIQYSSWEHERLPKNGDRLWQIQSYLRKAYGPIIVMSLSGVGRASAYFLFELLHYQLHNRQQEEVNLEKSVSFIRSQRQASLQSATQIDYVIRLLSSHFKRKKEGRKTDDE